MLCKERDAGPHGSFRAEKQHGRAQTRSVLASFASHVNVTALKSAVTGRGEHEAKKPSLLYLGTGDAT